jgi:hypothetical protein
MAAVRSLFRAGPAHAADQRAAGAMVWGLVLSSICDQSGSRRSINLRAHSTGNGMIAQFWIIAWAVTVAIVMHVLG